MNPTLEIVCKTCRKIKHCPYIDRYIRSGACEGGHCLGWIPSIKAKREAIDRYEGALKEDRQGK